jgi:hypothetical protein
VSFASRLTHQVVIERPGVSVSVDEYNNPIPGSPTTRTVWAAIQPRKAIEVAQLNQAGVAVSDHVIYLLPIDITTADAIVHTAADCPMTSDLPDGRYEITGAPNAAGLGHHLELDCHLVALVGQAVGV